MGSLIDAKAVMRDAIVCDMTLPWIKGFIDEDETLPRFHRAGIDFVSLTVNVAENPLAATIHHIAKVKSHILARHEQMILAVSAEEIVSAKASGRLAIGLHFQSTEPLERAVEMVRTFYDLGVRHMLLAYNQKNAIGDGCAERTDSGLSRYGIQLIDEMNRVGVLVDGSHTGYRTTMEAMEVCKGPFIFSHSNVHALVPHYRNIRDDQIRACARSGGLVGINGVNEFLADPVASTEAMFRHVDYVSRLVGPSHVGIGLDYVQNLEAVWKWVQSDPSLWPDNSGVAPEYPAHAQPEQITELAALMLERGYSTEDVRGILGGNFLRVMRAARATVQSLSFAGAADARVPRQQESSVTPHP